SEGRLDGLRGHAAFAEVGADALRAMAARVEPPLRVGPRIRRIVEVAELAHPRDGLFGDVLGEPLARELPHHLRLRPRLVGDVVERDGLRLEPLLFVEERLLLGHAEPLPLPEPGAHGEVEREAEGERAVDEDGDALGVALLLREAGDGAGAEVALRLVGVGAGREAHAEGYERAVSPCRRYSTESARRSSARPAAMPSPPSTLPSGSRRRGSVRLRA